MDRSKLLPTESYIPPRSEREELLVSLWEETLRIQPVGVRDSFFDLVGRNTLMAIRLSQRILEVTGRSLPISSLLSAPTIEDQIQILEYRDPEEGWSPIVQILPGRGHRSFYCAPGIAGDLFMLAALAESIGVGQSFYGFLYPGLDGLSQPIKKLEDLAGHLVRALQTVQPEGPYDLGGYSFGGMVAFEMAQQLIATGKRVRKLVLIDTFAQHPRLRYAKSVIDLLARPLDVSQSKREQWFVHFRNRFYRVAYFLQHELTRSWWWDAIDVMQKLRSKDQGQGSTVEIEALGRLDGRWEKFRLDRVRDRLTQINDHSYREYVPRTYEGDVVLIRSEDGHGHPTVRPTDASLGWNAVVKRGVEVRKVPGDHMGMLRKPRIEQVASHIREGLKDD